MTNHSPATVYAKRVSFDSRKIFPPDDHLTHDLVCHQ